MGSLTTLKPAEAFAAADFLDSRTWILRWLVALLRHYEEMPEDAMAYWRLLWDRGREGLLAHFFHNGTTYIFGQEAFDWAAAAGICTTDFLPERIIGDRGVVERWRAQVPELFEGAQSTHELDVLALDPEARELPRTAPEGFRVANAEERSLLEEYERLHCQEVGLEPVEVDFKSLIENQMAFVVEDRGQVAGCVRSNLSDGRYVHVGGLYVHPRHRGRRLGQRLAVGVAWWVQKHDRAKALLDAYADNTAALRIYEQAGYCKVGEGLEVRFGESTWQ